MSSIYQQNKCDKWYVYFQYSRKVGNHRKRKIIYVGKYSTKQNPNILEQLKSTLHQKYVVKNIFREEVYYYDDLVDKYIKHLRSTLKNNQITLGTFRFQEGVLKLFRKWFVSEYGNRNIKSISTKIMRDWLYHRETVDKISSSTIINNKSGMKMFFVWCKDNGYINIIPTDGIKNPRRQTNVIYPEQDEWNTFVNYCKEKVENEPFIFTRTKKQDEEPNNFQFMYYVQCKTGCRLSEILNLKWKQNPNEDTVGGSKQFSYLTNDMKGMVVYSKRKKREIPIEHLSSVFEKIPRTYEVGRKHMFIKNRKTGDYYRKRRNRKEIQSTYVFENPNKQKQYSLSQSQFHLKDMLKKLGLNNKISSHCWRRGFIMELIRKEVPIVNISKIVGHNSTIITEKYGFMFRDDLKPYMDMIMD